MGSREKENKNNINDRYKYFMLFFHAEGLDGEGCGGDGKDYGIQSVINPPRRLKSV